MDNPWPVPRPTSLVVKKWSKTRDLLLFPLGTGNALRIWDLLKLTMGEVRSMKAGDAVPVVESRSGRETVLTMNRWSYEALQDYLEWIKPQQGPFILYSAYLRRN